MRPSVYGLCFVAILTVPSAASAADLKQKDGNELLGACGPVLNSMDGISQNHGAEDSMLAGFCMGYLYGITGVNVLYQVSLPSKDSLFFCSPKEGISTAQAVRVVVNYLRAHPEELHKQAMVLTLDALGKAFPCRQ